jgi:hypothetical protein
MTMLSFRVADDEPAEAPAWADRLGLDRSELLREALHGHLIALRREREGDLYEQLPVTDLELSLAEVADWGPAEDWADWLKGVEDEAG